MVRLFRDFSVETRVHVFQDDVLLCVLELCCIEVGGHAGFGEGVDVFPFLEAGTGGVCLPFFAEGVGEGCEAGELVFLF